MQIERKIQRFDFQFCPNLIFKIFPVPRGLESHALEKKTINSDVDWQTIFSACKLNILGLRKSFSEPWTGYSSDDMWIKWKTWLNGPCDEYFCDFYEIFCE